MITNVNSIVNIIGETYTTTCWLCKSKTSIMNNIFIRGPKLMREVATALDLDMLTTLVSCLGRSELVGRKLPLNTPSILGPLHTRNWEINGKFECKTNVKSTWIPTWHQIDHVSWSLGLFNFQNNLLEVGVTHNQGTTAFRTLTTVDLFYFVMCEDPHEQKFIEIASGWGHGHMSLHTALEDPWPHLHDVGGVLGRPLDTFFWALTISWSRLLARVWSGPCACERPVTWYSIHQSLSSFSSDTRQTGKASYWTWYVCILLGNFITYGGHPFDWIQILLPFAHFPIRMPPNGSDFGPTKWGKSEHHESSYWLRGSSSLLLGFALATSTIPDVQWILVRS